MGNVSHKGKRGGLTKFQKRKLKYDFHTFFDLNNDGCLTYNDFLWAKDKICGMSGWKIDSAKYKVTEALFKEIWESLAHIADINNDGRITQAEWLAMWATYKSEIMEREMDEKDFLKNFYERNRAQHEGEETGEGGGGGGAGGRGLKGAAAVGVENENETEAKQGRQQMNEALNGERRNSDDYDVQLDSDEEPLSILERRKAELKAEKSMAPPENKKVEDAEEVVEDEEEASVLEKFAKDKANYEDTKLPKWLYKYLVYRFNLLDRTGDNVIDNEEFEYVLSEFGVSERTARQAFTIFTENNSIRLDFEYFVHLFEEYYLSDDPSSLGNFINGRLEYESIYENDDDDNDDEEEDPGALDHHANSSTSIHSMDDDIHGNNGAAKKKKKANDGKSGSVIRLHEKATQLCDDVKSSCCVLF